MKFAEQATNFGMTERHGIYEKDVNGFKMIYTMKVRPGALVKTPHIAFVFNRPLDKHDMQTIRKTFGMLANSVFFEGVGLQNNAAFMLGNLNLKQEKRLNKFNEKLNRLTEAFHALGLMSLAKCPFCLSEEPTDSHRFMNGVVVDVHEACISSFVAEAEKEIEAEEQSKGMAKSLVYALIGAIFGAVPAIIVLFLGYFFGPLFALIPLASFYFYKYGKGPKKMVVIVFISLISLLLVPGIMLSLYSMSASVSGLTLMEAIEADQAFATEFYGNFGMSFLFSIFGIIFASGYMFRQSTTASKKKIEAFKSRP